ncbi:MAG: hypothetical protein BWY54_00827 [Candidatus Dependentiae bacterium ADurb.Bin331]|nr:MAG: hypothetical protein BWY54_00827 [Candidatus Dependentiae bacterium ADurb.Bin331]
MLKTTLVLAGVLAMLSGIANGMNFETAKQAQVQLQMFVIDEKDEKKAMDKWALFTQRLSNMSDKFIERVTESNEFKSARERIDKSLRRTPNADIRFEPDYIILMVAHKRLPSMANKPSDLQKFVHYYEKLKEKVDNKELTDSKKVLRKYDRDYKKVKNRLKAEFNITMNEVAKQLDAMSFQIEQLRMVIEDSSTSWRKPTAKLN